MSGVYWVKAVQLPVMHRTAPTAPSQPVQNVSVKVEKIVKKFHLLQKAFLDSLNGVDMFLGSHALLILAVTASTTLWSLDSRERAWLSLNLHLWLPFSLACASLKVRDYCHLPMCLRQTTESDSWWVPSKYLLKEQMDGWMDEWMKLQAETQENYVIFFLCVLVAQACLTLCDPMDCSPPGSFIHGFLQSRIRE